MNFNANRTGAKSAVRRAVILLCGAVLCAPLTGCRSTRPQDGVYTARYQYPSHGYVEYLTVTFRDGRAAEVEFDAYSETDPNAKKSSLTKEEYPMDPHPSEWMNTLERNIEKAGLKPDKIAAVAGATSSSRHARELYDAVLKAARDGKTETVLVQNEEDGPDSGMTDNSDNTGMSGSAENSSVVPGDVGNDQPGTGAENGIGADSGTIPGANSGNDGSSMSGTASDSSSMTGSDENPGQENASGGNGTGTGEDNSANAGMSGSMGAAGDKNTEGGTGMSGNTGTVGGTNGSVAP